MGRIKIKDLNVNLEELKKKDPEILKKIRGGAGLVMMTVYCQGGGAMSGGCAGMYPPSTLVNCWPPGAMIRC